MVKGDVCETLAALEQALEDRYGAAATALMTSDNALRVLRTLWLT